MGNISSASLEANITPLLEQLGSLDIERELDSDSMDKLALLLHQNPAGLYNYQEQLSSLHTAIPPCVMAELIKYGLDLRHPKYGPVYFNHFTNIKFHAKLDNLDAREKNRRKIERELQTFDVMYKYLMLYTSSGIQIPANIYSPLETNKTSFGQQAQQYGYTFESYCLLDFYSDYSLPTNNQANSVLSYLYTSPIQGVASALFPPSMHKNCTFLLVAQPNIIQRDPVYMKQQRRFLSTMNSTSVTRVCTLIEAIENHPSLESDAWKEIDQKFGDNGLVWTLLMHVPVTADDLFVIFTGKARRGIIPQITTGVKVNHTCGPFNMYPVMLAILRQLPPGIIRYFLNLKDNSINHQDKFGRTILMYLLGCHYGSRNEQDYVDLINVILDVPHLDVDLVDHNDQNLIFYLFQSRATLNTQDYLNKIIAKSKDSNALFHSVNQNGHGFKPFYYYDKVNASLRNRPPTPLTNFLVVREYGEVTRSLFDIFPNRAYQIYRWLLSKINIDLGDYDLMRIIFNHILILDSKTTPQEFHANCFEHNHSDVSKNLSKCEPFPPPLTEMTQQSPTAASSPLLSPTGRDTMDSTSRDSESQKASYSTGSTYIPNGGGVSTPDLTCYQIHDCLRRLVNVTVSQVKSTAKRNKSLHQLIHAAITRTCHPTIFDTILTAVVNAITVIHWSQFQRLDRYLPTLLESAPKQYLDRLYSYGFDVNCFESRPFDLLYYKETANVDKLAAIMARGARFQTENNLAEQLYLKAYREQNIRSGNPSNPYKVYATAAFYCKFKLPCDTAQNWGQLLSSLQDKYKMLVFASYMISINKPISLSIDTILETEDIYQFNQYTSSTQFKDLFHTVLPHQQSLSKVKQLIPSLDLPKLNNCHANGLLDLGLNNAVLRPEDIKLLDSHGLLNANSTTSSAVYKENLFMTAILRQYPSESLSILLKTVSDLNYVDTRNRSVLMYMIAARTFVDQKSFFDEVLRSSKHEIDFALFDKKRLSYLHYALKYAASTELVELLLSKSEANPLVSSSFFATTRKNKTVVDYATANAYPQELIDKLRKLVAAHAPLDSAPSPALTNE